MRTAADFNQLYATRDPWGISRARFRDKALGRCVGPFVAGERVLELGCGEGHLTAAIFGAAGWVTGVDISDVAITRARALDLANARFNCRDFMDVSFRGYDVIAAIESLHYLSREEQRAFLDKVKREHRGILIVSGPIIGGEYFTHIGLMEEFRERGLQLLEQRNTYVRRSGAALPIDLAIRASGIPELLDWIPDALVYQRCYVTRCFRPIA